MEIRTRTNEYEMTPEVEAYLVERMAHVEKLLGDDAENARCEVALGRDAGRPRHGANMWFADLRLSYPGGPTLGAANHSESINGAIDDAKSELERQIKRERKLHIKLLRKSGATFKRFVRRGF